MTTEDDFQKALDSNPEDNQTRLVFADWLQERNDPRAEGYRELGRLGKKPYVYFFREMRFAFLTQKRPVGDPSTELPEWWMQLLLENKSGDATIHATLIPHWKSRQQAEDAAAHTYARIAKILSTPFFAIESRDVYTNRKSKIHNTKLTVTNFQIVRTVKDHLRWKPLERARSIPYKKFTSFTFDFNALARQYSPFFHVSTVKPITHHAVTKQQLCWLAHWYFKEKIIPLFQQDMEMIPYSQPGLDSVD